MRKISRYYDYLSTLFGMEPVDADIHVITSEDSSDSYKGPDGRTIFSRSGWAELTRGKFRVYQGYGQHGYMLRRPYREANAALLYTILDDYHGTASSR